MSAKTKKKQKQTNKQTNKQKKQKRKTYDKREKTKQPEQLVIEKENVGCAYVIFQILDFSVLKSLEKKKTS